MTQKMTIRVHWVIVVVCAICELGICPNLHADAFDDAERSAKDLMYYYEDFRKLDLDMTLRLVQAISEADDDARRDVSERATRDAQDRINSEFSKVEKRKDEALKLLEDVRNNPEFREKFSDVDRL